MRFALLVMLIGFLFSCQPKKSGNRNDFQNLSDTTRLPGMTRDRLNQKLNDALLLPKLDRGVDSFELRVWSKWALIDPDFVTILRYQDSTWYVSETTFWKKPIDNLNSSFIVDSSKTIWFTPRLPYQAIVDSVLKFRLDTIPTQQLTPNFEDRTADGITYTIELSTKHFYKSVTYRNPKYYTEFNHQKINAFLKFCAKNLGVMYY